MYSNRTYDLDTAPAATAALEDDVVTITSDDGGDAAAFVQYENGYSITAVHATSSAGAPITYSIVGGADSARFEINASTGALNWAWNCRPDYEAPGDSDANNTYEVIVAASDGTASDQQTITVQVINVNEAPVITSYGGAASVSLSVAENTIVAATFSAVDPEHLGNLSYAIVGGADSALFTVNPWNGLLIFRSAPDFEAPADSGANNVYDVVVRATDQVNTVTQTFAITVTNAAAESTFNGTSNNDTTNGTAGSDTIYGQFGTDTLFGLGGDDVLDGGSSGDVLVGGTGVDSLLGGAGADKFRFDAPGESAVGSPDTIFDFVRSQSDRISLTGMDANTLLAGDQNFTFIGSSAFSGVAGELRFDRGGGFTQIFGDVNGDAVADFQIQVNGELTMFSSDFLL